MPVTKLYNVTLGRIKAKGVCTQIYSVSLDLSANLSAAVHNNPFASCNSKLSAKTAGWCRCAIPHAETQGASFSTGAEAA